MVYSKEFRQNAIRQFEEIGSYWKAAKALNVSIATLHRWVRLSATDEATEATDEATEATSQVKTPPGAPGT